MSWLVSVALVCIKNPLSPDKLLIIREMSHGKFETAEISNSSL